MEPHLSQGSIGSGSAAGTTSTGRSSSTGHIVPPSATQSTAAGPAQQHPPQGLTVSSTGTSPTTVVNANTSDGSYASAEASLVSPGPGPSPGPSGVQGSGRAAIHQTSTGGGGSGAAANLPVPTHSQRKGGLLSIEDITEVSSSKPSADSILRLQAEIHELHLENEMLRRQNHQVSVLLDVAVAKLESLGYSIIPPFDVGEGIRKLIQGQERDRAYWANPMLGRESAAGQPVGSGAAEGGMRHREDTKGGKSGGGQTSINSGGSAHHQTSTRRFRLLSELKEHSSAVQCGCFSPNGAMIATGSFDSKVVVWGRADQKVILSVKGQHSMSVSDLSWAPSSTRLVSSSFDGTCRCFPIDNPTQPLHVFEPYDAVFMLTCAASPHSDSLYFTSDSKGGVHMVDIRVKPRPSSVFGLAGTLSGGTGLGAGYWCNGVDSQTGVGSPSPYHSD